MKHALLISGIIEIIGSLVLYFIPEQLFSINEGFHIITKLYGLTMFVVGLLNILAFSSYQKTKFFKQIFLTMMGFHAALAMLSYSASPIQFPLYNYGSIVHGLLFGLFLLGYLKDA